MEAIGAPQPVMGPFDITTGTYANYRAYRSTNPFIDTGMSEYNITIQTS